MLVASVYTKKKLVLCLDQERGIHVGLFLEVIIYVYQNLPQFQAFEITTYQTRHVNKIFSAHT